MSKIRWGILSVAKVNQRYYPAFAKAENAELVAIASREPERAQAAAKAAGIAKAYVGYDNLLADPEIDAVYIPLPNNLHAEWTRKAADAGKHVLCEKPLAPTAAEAADLIAYCRSKNVQLMDGFMWPHHARTAKIRELLDAKAIGDIRHVAGAFTFNLPIDSPNIRFQPGMGGGSLLDVGCYPVYGIRWVYQAEPIRVSATGKFADGVDIEMAGVLEFSDGRTGAFDCGFTAPLRQWLEITGTVGVLRMHEMWVPNAPADYALDRDNQQLVHEVVESRDQIVNLLEEFGRAIQEKREPRPSIEEAVKTLKVLDALAKSARDGKPVEILGS